MLTIPTLVAGWLTLVLILQAGAASAQSTFGNLPARIRSGQKVIVVDEQGSITEGTVQDISASKLVVDYSRGRITDPSLPTTRTFTPEQVRRVQKPAHLWDGAIKGGVVGLIPASVALSTHCDDCGLGSFAVFAVSVGAAAGVGIDALFGPKTIYRRDGGRSRVSLVPLVGRDRRGFAASFRF